jgi:hypothetical protein
MLFGLFEPYSLDAAFVNGVWFVGISILIGSVIIAWAIRSGPMKKTPKS